MPPRSLDEYFDKDHWTAQRFATDHPKGVAWTIVAVGEEQVRAAGKREDKPVVWFRESDKWIELNGPMYEFLRARLGPVGDGSAWKEAVVTLRAIDGEGFGGVGYGIRAVAVQPPRAEPARKPRVFGDVVAKKLTATLHELGSGIDALTEWLRREDPAAYEGVAGREMHEWLDVALPACQRFCGELRKSRAAADAAKPAPSTPAPSRGLPKPSEIPDDDIPF
jgi:hypothetical protein